jgi:hypothetical protein
MFQYPLLTYISLFSVVLPIGVGITRIRTLQQGMKILFYYLIFAFTADIYLLWFARGYQFTLGLYHVYYLVEFVFIMSIISIWQESHRMKRIFQIVMLLYILFWIIAKCTFEPLTGLYSVIASASQVLLAFGAGYTLYFVIEHRVQPLINDYRFWVLFSFVIYYTGTLWIVASRGNFIHYSRETIFIIASLDWALKIFFNILFAIGFLCPQTRT